MGANNKVGPTPLWVDKFGLSDRFRAAVIWSRGNESLRVLVVEDDSQDQRCGRTTNRSRPR